MSAGVPDISTALQAAVDGVATQGLAAVAAVFPALFTVVGAVLVWNVGLSVFRRMRV